MLDFTLPSNKDCLFRLSDYDKPIVLFFYPRDNTPGCTIENQDFTRLYNEFAKINVEVVGISRDSVTSHCKFADKFNIPFLLLADTDETVCNLFNVIKYKNMYGKKVRGIERSTFILDKNKNIVKEWRKIKVDNHAQEVLDFVRKTSQ